MTNQIYVAKATPTARRWLTVCARIVQLDPLQSLEDTIVKPAIPQTARKKERKIKEKWKEKRRMTERSKSERTENA